MASDPGALARGVVDGFGALLDGTARAAVGDHRLSALEGMVREAIAEHADAIFEQLEQDLKKHRADMVERRPLEL